MIVPSPSATSMNAVALTRAQARLVWSLLAGLVVVAVVAAIVGAAVVPARADSQLGQLFLILAAVFVPVDLAVGHFVAARIRSNPTLPRDAIAGTQVIVGCAVAVGASLLCCVFYFVGRQPLVLLLVLPCAAMLVRWFPSEARWAALAPSPGPAPGAPPRNPMVRE